MGESCHPSVLLPKKLLLRKVLHLCQYRYNHPSEKLAINVECFIFGRFIVSNEILMYDIELFD